ncbi:MAG: cellulase family glycosylhydrolase [Oscillospiraceae bacterium]|nr:cellulase family glycosylhydrolase [Oscillospiraceae bacterium]
MIKKRIISALLTLTMLLGVAVITAFAEESAIMTTSRSIDYAENMGIGWNLGNTLDGRGGNNLAGWETAWGNPVTTKEFIQSIADRGFEHIRIPFTIDNRHTDNGADTPDSELRYVIHEDWVNRYIEIVEWAVEAGLVVMINIHHDAWIWLGRGNNSWDGDVASDQYRRYTDHWKQLAAAFAQMPDSVMFETINEPEFNAHSQARLDTINRAAYDIIRGTAGNENRIIVIPTLHTNHGPANSSATRDFIKSLNDENIIATVHYYCEWVFGANLGITKFDEDLYEDRAGYSARSAVDSFYKTIDEYFLSEGIGVTVGEWGLLAYDGGTDILQTGEELKYYEYVQYLASQNRGVSLSFWDNGSGINRRDTPDFGWHQPRVGAVLESFGARSSYSTGLDTIYFSGAVTEDIEIPLTLNGNEFVGIDSLIEGKEYTYDAETATVSIDAEFISWVLQEAITFTVTLQFSAGADWLQTIVRLGTPEYGLASGTRSAGISIPVNFNGAHIRNITAEQNGNRVGGNQLWWRFLHNGEAFHISYGTGHLILLGNFFGDSVKEGEVTLNINYFDGSSQELIIDVLGESGGSAVTTVPAPELPLMPVNIDSLTYNFLIENVTDEETITFEMIGDTWPARSEKIELDGDGEYSVTVDFSTGIAGIIHLGFVHVKAGSEATITVKSIVVNDEIEMAFVAPLVMQLGSGEYNTMPHRWFVGDNSLLGGERVYDGRNIAFSSDNQYRFEFSYGVDVNETGIIVLYQNEAEEAAAAADELPTDLDADDSENAVEAAGEPASGSDTGFIIAVIIVSVLLTLSAVAFVIITRRKKAQ